MSENSAALFSYETGRIVQTHRLGYAAFVAAGSPDGNSYALQTSAFYASLFGRDGQRLAQIRHSNAIQDLAFSPDGNALLTVGIDRAARLWDSRSGTAIVSIADHSNEIRFGEFLRNGLQMVTVQTDGLVRVWNRPLDVYRSVADLATKELMIPVRQLAIINIPINLVFRYRSDSSGRFGLLQSFVEMRSLQSRNTVWSHE